MVKYSVMLGKKKNIEINIEGFLENSYFFLGKLIENIENMDKKALESFYIKECRKLINKKIQIFQKELLVKPKSIQIENSSKAWGTCNSNKKLTFHYELIKLPEELIDYVVVHELCHLMHMNHDRSFWRKVGSVNFNYKENQELLKIWEVILKNDKN